MKTHWFPLIKPAIRALFSGGDGIGGGPLIHPRIHHTNPSLDMLKEPPKHPKKSHKELPWNTFHGKREPQIFGTPLLVPNYLVHAA